ncbi:MAG: DUF2490 domain-containing protein [Methylotenera sp.]
MLRSFIVLIISLLPLVSNAEILSRTSTWLMSLSRIKLTESVNSFIDIQPRYTMNDTSGGKNNAFDTLLLRGAIGYQISPNAGLYQGYAYIPTYDPKNVEHRSFQELFINQPLQNNSLAHRLRFEQRFIESIDETAYRIRYFGRYVHALPTWHPNLSLAINEEIFINLNDAENGPQSGFDQNRLFIGLNYRVNNNLAYEFGYQNQTVNVSSSNNNVMNHILFLGIQSNFSLLD